MMTTKVAAMKAALKEYDETQPKGIKSFMEKNRMMEEIMIAEHGDDYEKTVSTFTLNKAEQAVVDAWLKSLVPEILRIQGKGPFGDDEPYYGAVGGGVTYNFIPTSMGTIITVKETTTGKELNVSDELHWYFYG